MSVLSAEGITFRRRGRTLLHPTNLEVHPGEVLAVVGPSGAGKSLLLWLLAGLLEPSAGHVQFSGDAAAGLALQPPGLWSHLTCARHVDIVLHGRCDVAERRRRVDAELAAAGLAHLADRRPMRLSTGERQRLSLARALAVRPRWLLLDEPLAHLDFSRRQEVLDRLRLEADTRGVGVLLVTHHGEEVLPIASRIAVLIGGRLQQIGPAADVYAHPACLEAARLLGEAVEFDGRMIDDALVVDGVAVLRGLMLPPGAAKVILRPAQLRFQPASVGPWLVKRCDLTPHHRFARLSCGGLRCRAAIDRPYAPGTRGVLLTS